MADKDTNILLAKVAEQAERYEDMKVYMKNVVELVESGLAAEERNLLSVAYKNVIGSRRAAWRIISSLESKESGKSENSNNLEHVQQYREKVEGELHEICDEILDLLDKFLIPQSSGSEDGDEATVFFYKMQGDYYRYLTEIERDEKKEEVCKKSKEAYEQAKKKADEKLRSTNPIRLGLYLNYSVFLYELANDVSGACKLAKEAFDNAIAELDSLQEEVYKDSTLIMQLLRDNLTLWTSEVEEADDDAK